MSEQAPKPSHIVAAGTPASRCRHPECDAVIYWTETKNGKRMPVDCDVPGGRHPSAVSGVAHQSDIFGGAADAFDGLGVSHFATCKRAADFRRPR